MLQRGRGSDSCRTIKVGKKNWSGRFWKQNKKRGRLAQLAAATHYTRRPMHSCWSNLHDGREIRALWRLKKEWFRKHTRYQLSLQASSSRWRNWQVKKLCLLWKVKVQNLLVQQDLHQKKKSKKPEGRKDDYWKDPDLRTISVIPLFLEDHMLYKVKNATFAEEMRRNLKVSTWKVISEPVISEA